MRKPKCPDERWQAESRQWKAVAERLARICAEQIGCGYDGEKHCPDGASCRLCWIQRAVRETAGKGD